VGQILVSIDIAAPPDRVWACIEDIGSHVNWMKDARAIRFTSTATAGVGTTFDCDTQIGPFKLTDHMEVTEWVPGEAMAIRHVGVVTGTGRFALNAIPAGTGFTWSEDLRFPPRQGGRLAAAVAAPVLRRLWRGNLERLRDLVQANSNQ
jgi:uncharacterized protein YndB with AHSA1/START domain